jgi:putative ABC transport system permease protein
VAAALRQRWGIQASHTWRGQAPSPGTIRLRTVREAQAQVRGFFDRLADYLGLVSLMALLLGGVGVAGVTRAFVRESAVSRGVLSAVGAGPPAVAAIFAWQCLLLGLLGGLLGAVSGALAQGLLARALSGLLPVALAAAWDWKALAWGLALGLLTALAFGLEPVFASAGQSAASMLRDEDAPPEAWARWRRMPLPSAAAWWRLGAAVLFAGVAALEARSWVRGPGAFAALLVAAALLQAAAQALLPWMARLRWPGQPFSLRQALSNLARPGLRAGAGLVALGCAALLLGVLAVYQHSLLSELEPARQRGRLPDLFLIDVQPGQLEGLKATVAATAPSARLELSPMVRGRYRGILGRAQPMSGSAGTREQEEAESLRTREQNLSWRASLGPGETLAAGKWMDPNGDEVEASLEEFFAQRLGAKLGDVLRFDVQGVEVQAKVTSLRKVDWASFQPNFFVLLSPWALQGAPQTWVGSIAGSGGEAQRQALQAAIVARYPNITFFEVAQATAKIVAILDKIAAAIQLVALACLATGLAVLAGLALATARSRRAEAALLKVLGARRSQLLASAGLEFGLLAGLAALLGLGLSLGLGWVLLVKVLELEYHAPWLLLAQLTLLFAATGAAVGLLSTWRVYQVPPAEVLRQD